MVDHFNYVPGELPRRSNSLVIILFGACAILVIICACLISTVVLIQQYQKSDKINENNKNFLQSIEINKPEMSYEWEKNLRIPDYVKPTYYDLFLKPSIPEGVFEGKVIISVKITQPTNHIPVHVKNMNVTKTILESDAGIRINHKNAFHYEKNQFWVIECEKNITLGNYKLSLDFEGKLTGKLVGFYRSTYTENNETRNIATTKFEPVEARQAFPCFDEPALKAKFRISIVRPKGYISLSNNVVLKEEEIGPNEVKVTFKDTPEMSTYLACFIICDFQHSGMVTMTSPKRSEEPEKPQHSYKFAVYSTPNQVENTLFAKSVGSQVTAYFEEYFGLDYVLDKLDLIAIPDFVSGAMENWGLVTFRETALLFNKSKNSAANEKRVATVVAHELAHQWFGNLVTMKWWDDLWLNEGFASFMEYKGVNAVKECRDWEIIDQAVIDDIQEVLDRDAALTSHPIVQPVDHPSQIAEIFDFISYKKGVAVLRMLEGFMGADNFRNGIRKYLEKYKFSNAATKDLWDCLTNEITGAGIDVQKVMDTWTLQKGFPVVTVKRESDGLVLTQDRFLGEANASYDRNESPFQYKWDIPIHYVTSENRNETLVWLKRNDPSLKIPVDPKVKYVKLNHLQMGFYRVNYELQDWKAFTSILTDNHEELDRVDRSQLLDDVFALAYAGHIDYPIALNFLKYLKNETELQPWETASSALGKLFTVLSSSIHYLNLKKFVKSIIAPKYGSGEGQFSLETPPVNSHLKRMVRNSVLSQACHAGYEPCLRDASKKFLDWIKDPNIEIHPDDRSKIYFYGMRAVGTEEEWNIVWERYKVEQNAQEKINLMSALAQVRDPSLINRFLQYSKNESYVRSQDFFILLDKVCTNPVGLPLVWNFYRNEYPELVKRFTLMHTGLGKSLVKLSSYFSTKLHLEEMEYFFKKYPDAGASSSSRNFALERVKGHIEWRARNEQLIGEWLQANV